MSTTSSSKAGGAANHARAAGHALADAAKTGRITVQTGV